MENQTVSGLRSRSRSKTPFLRSSCDHENCMEGGEHTHKSGRKTPVKRSTPIKQLNKVPTDPITEEEEQHESPPAHRTRNSLKAADKLVKTSDYSSEESLDQLKGQSKEIIQNELNSQYERVSTTTQSYSTLADVTFSPINATRNITNDRSSRFSSPAYSACSTDSSFAEQALQEASTLLDHEPTVDHLPYRLYKIAGEYWNKYPKTDFTYSRLSKDRVELLPGQVAVPNMSRRSLSQFRIQGPNTSEDEIDRLTAYSTNTRLRKYAALDSSDDESAYIKGNGGYVAERRRWWITSLLLSVVTAITTTTSSAYRKIVGPSHTYPYRTDRRNSQAGIASRTASAAAAPFYWIYTVIKKVVNTTITTVTETIAPNHVSESENYIAHSYLATQTAKRRWWPWLLLLLLPFIGYGAHYAYENLDDLAMPNFTDIYIDLSEFSAAGISKIALPNITLPDMNILPNITLPQINITLPDIRDNLPEVTKTYVEYRDNVQNRMVDASDYMKVVAESCFEEMKRFWRGVIG